MSPITDVSLFKSRNDIVNAMLLALESAIPDVYIGDDGIVKILFSIEAGQLENAFLANQLLFEDIFPQTASEAALEMHGLTYALPFKTGKKATGSVTFSGSGGTVINLGSEVGASLGTAFDPIVFTTDAAATIPNPGDPTALTAAESATAGNLNGTYEYQVTFVTAAGETLVGDTSAPIQPTNKQATLTVIPIGGVGTTARKIYRRKDGVEPFKLVTTISDNVTTIYTDNIADGSLTTSPPAVNTAERITVTAVAIAVGIEGNVVPGAIQMLIDVSSGVTSVINSAAFANGENPETGEQYRSRLLSYIRNPRTGATVDLKFWAETVNGVAEATVFNNDNLGTPTNGHATIRISGPAGAIPGAPVIAEVQALLELKDLANITIHVATFTQVPLNVTCNATEDSTHTLGDITPGIQAAISSYINSVPVGGIVYLSGIVDAVYGLDGVLDVTVSVPASNQTATATQKFTVGTIVVT